MLSQNLTELNNHLTASNAAPFRFGYDSTSDKYGYILSEGGADTFVPFSSGDDYSIDALEISFSGYSSGSAAGSNNPWGCVVLTDRETNTISRAITDAVEGNHTARVNGGTYLSVYISPSAQAITFKKRCKAIIIRSGGVVAETTYEANSSYTSSGVVPCMVIVTEDLEDNIKVTNAKYSIMDSYEVIFGTFPQSAGSYVSQYGSGAAITRDSSTGKLSTLYNGFVSNGLCYAGYTDSGIPVDSQYVTGVFYKPSSISIKKKCAVIVGMSSPSSELGYRFGQEAEVGTGYAGLGAGHVLFAIVVEDLSE